MRSNIYKTAAGTALLLFCMSAFAADGAITLLEKGITDALDKIFADLQVWALGVLGLFMLLQFTWTHIHVLLNGAELERVWSKFVGSLFWFGMCFYIFKEGPPFIKGVASQIMNKSTGVTGATFDPMAPIDKGIDVASQLLETFNGSQSVLGSLNPFPSIMLGLVSIVILAVSALLAFKIFMVFIETKMVIALSPLSFALLGLNAFKDQGLAPLKYLVSMALRMFLYGAVLAAMVVFSETIIASFKALPPSTDPSVWPPIWAAAIGYVLLGAVALRVDSIAAMLASGSSQMSTGDSAAVGAIAGAAAGMAMAAATGGASVAAAAAKPVQSMGDFMKSMGGGGSVSNASSRGMGGASNSLPLSPPPVSSMGSGGGGGAGAKSATSTTTPTQSSKPTSPAQAKSFVAPEPRPQPKSVTALLQDSQNASSGASAAGAPPQAVQAAGDAAYGGGVVGGSPQQIEDAVVAAGGTQEQGRAAAAAVESTTGGGIPTTPMSPSAAAGKAGPSVADDGGKSAAMDGARSGALSAGSSNTAAEAGAVAAGNGGNAKAIGDAVLQAGGNQSQAAAAVKSASAAGAEAIKSGGGGLAGAPVASPNAAKPPSTGAGTHAASSSLSPGASDTSLQSPPAGPGAVGGGGSMGAGKPPSPGAADTSLQSPPADSGSSAGVDGTESTSPALTMDALKKAMESQNKPSTDRMRGLKDHVLNDAPAVHISMNTHQD